MKYFKQIIACVALIVSAQSLFAEHKDVVYVINNFGEEVSVNLKWSPKPSSYSFFNKEDEFSVYEDDVYDDSLEGNDFNMRFQHKAPLSKYYLSEIVVASSASKMEAYQEQMALALSSDPYSKVNQYSPAPNLHEVRFKFTKPLSNSLFFVIEIDEQKSIMSGRKQIKLNRFLSRDAYRKELQKTNPSRLVQRMQPARLEQPVYQSPQFAQAYTQQPSVQQEYYAPSNQQYRYELAQDQEFGGIDFHGFGG